MNNQRIGFKAEMEVAAVLPGAVVVNEAKEQRKPYDLLWNDIQIDVKGTQNVLGVRKRSCTFTANLSSAHTGVIIVFIAMLDDGNRYWVERYSNSIPLYRSLESSINAEDVPAVILTAAKRPVEVLIGLNAYTQLKVKDEYREKLAKLASSHNRSMANMIEVLIDQEVVGPDPSESYGGEADG